MMIARHIILVASPSGSEARVSFHRWASPAVDRWGLGLEIEQ